MSSRAGTVLSTVAAQRDSKMAESHATGPKQVGRISCRRTSGRAVSATSAGRGCPQAATGGSFVSVGDYVERAEEKGKMHPAPRSPVTSILQYGTVD